MRLNRICAGGGLTAQDPTSKSETDNKGASVVAVDAVEEVGVAVGGGGVVVVGAGVGSGSGHRKSQCNRASHSETARPAQVAYRHSRLTGAMGGH